MWIQGGEGERGDSRGGGRESSKESTVGMREGEI